MLVPTLNFCPQQLDRDLLCYLFLSGIHHKGEPIRNIVIPNRVNVSECLLTQDKTKVFYNHPNAESLMALDQEDWLVFTRSNIEAEASMGDIKNGKKFFDKIWGVKRIPIYVWAGKYTLVHFINSIVFFCSGVLVIFDECYNPFTVKYIALATIFSLLFTILSGVVGLCYMLYQAAGYYSCWGINIRPKHVPFYLRMLYGTLLTLLISILVSPLGLWVLLRQGF